MDWNVNSNYLSRRIKILRYNHATYSNEVYIDLGFVMAIGELEKEHGFFFIYFRNGDTWRIAAKCYDELLNAWLAV